MDERTKELVESYEKERRMTLKKVLWLLLAMSGVALIVTGILFRTQYPMRLTDRGQLHYVYSHILLRDQTRYDYFNNVKGHEVKYFIVYRNASLYYEQETNFTTYSAHANKENVQPGITNHSVIRESVEKYTFTDSAGNTYCYDKKTSVIKALFDASFAGGKIYLRFAAEACGAVLALIGLRAFIKLKKKEHYENQK